MIEDLGDIREFAASNPDTWDDDGAHANVERRIRWEDYRILLRLLDQARADLRAEKRKSARAARSQVAESRSPGADEEQAVEVAEGPDADADRAFEVAEEERRVYGFDSLLDLSEEDAEDLLEYLKKNPQFRKGPPAPPR